MAVPPAQDAVIASKYRLVRELGVGGMGVVFEAEHLRLRQPFAIKILQPELALEKEFLVRFEREARAAALLKSPHIVRVFDVDVTPDGLSYMVMELLEGCDLADEVARVQEQQPQRPFDARQLVTWIIEVCAGLQEAHDAGIVHRDLKPANIFLAKTQMSGERIAKVLDFGISKSDVTSTNMSVVTNRAAGALGTPTYMAPEQIRSHRVDGRADLWAIGVILYRVLSGRWPFSGDTDQSYMASVLADPPLPFEMVRPDLPYELANVIMKLLEKLRDDRFASASEVATALKQAVATGFDGAAATNKPPIESEPMAIVVPADVSARAHVDRDGTMPAMADTVPQQLSGGPGPGPAPAPAPAPRPPPPRVSITEPLMSLPPRAAAFQSLPPSVSQPLAASTPTSAQTVFAQQTLRSSRGGSIAVLAFACIAAGIGFAAYMFLTAAASARRAKEENDRSNVVVGSAPSSITSASSTAETIAASSSAASSSAAAIESAVPLASASVPTKPHRKGIARPPPTTTTTTTTTAATTTSTSAPASPSGSVGLPDHL